MASTSANSETPAPPCTLVIFGARGDLTKRLLIPALYNLGAGGNLAPDFRLIGVDHGDCDTEGWTKSLRETLQTFVGNANAEFHPDRIEDSVWKKLAGEAEYVIADFEDADSFTKLCTTLEGMPSKNAIFYLATSPAFFETIIDNLGTVGLLTESDGAFRRVIIEKPFGRDLPSAKALNANISKRMNESQIYRIDHFMGKDAIRSIMAFRFANAMFEPAWRIGSIARVNIYADEVLGVEDRGKFYDATGALRDMIPSHLFTVMTLIGMERPQSEDPETVRSEKARFLQAIRPIDPADAVRGQYTAGAAGGKQLASYRDSENVDPKSNTETFAAVKVFVDNDRWRDVPFVLSTGKALSRRRTAVEVVFKASDSPFFAEQSEDANTITFLLNGDEDIAFAFNVKKPGLEMSVASTDATFVYGKKFPEVSTVGYEPLLDDCMRGDVSLFHRDDAIDASWAAVQPVLDAWKTGEPVFYAAGSDGPKRP